MWWWWLIGWPLLWLGLLCVLAWLARDPGHQQFLRRQRRYELNWRREKRTKAILRRIK